MPAPKSDTVILNLNDGTTRTCLVPWNDEMRQALFDCGQAPERVKGKTLKLSTPEKGIFEIKADDISAIEIWPPHFLITNLLSPEEVDRATAHVLERESIFTDATVYTVDRDGHNADTRFRRSRILDDVNDVAPLVANRLQNIIPQIWTQLRLPDITINRMECQITAHGDGDFFETHTDNSMPDIAHRKVSYVYYFHQEPKRFTGGHLRFYHSKLKDGVNSAGVLAADIEPPRNSLMIFPSHTHHEVTPISCATTALADQRLTINGWLCV